MTIEATRLVTHQAAWLQALSTGIPGGVLTHFPRLTLRVPFDEGQEIALARARHGSLCVISRLPGDPATELQAFDDDAVWVVLAGEASFRTEGAREVARVHQYQGLLVPKGEPCSYVNSGDGLLIMLRGAAREHPLEGTRDFFRGSSEGGTEAISWRRDPWPGMERDPGPFQRFNLRFPLRGENVSAWRVLARTERLAMHASSLEPGRGEVNLHAHDDEAIWVVLFGQATFYGEEENRELCTLRPHDGIVIPQDQLYRYVNTGDGYLHMLRFGCRAQPAPALDGGGR